MRPGFYMHEDAMDVCIEVKRVQYSDQKRIRVKALWWNLGYSGNPYLIYYNPETLTILRKDLYKWIGINNKFYTKRNKPGLPE